MVDFRQYGIIPERERDYENIAYVMALVYNMCEKKIAKLLAEYKISIAQYNVLLVTKSQAQSEGITQVEIGKRLIVSPGGITRLIDKLVKEKLLIVKQNKNNRRENLVNITSKGLKLIDAIWPSYDKLMREFTNMIPKAKQKEFASILANWFTKLQGV